MFIAGKMQRYERDDDPLNRPIQRRETTPARIMEQPVPLTPSSRQPTSSFRRRVPAQPGIVNGAGVQAFYTPYAPYYPGSTPQAVPMYYQPQPMHFISMQPQLGMPDPSLMGSSTALLPGVPLSSLSNSGARASRSRSRSRQRSRRRSPVDLRAYSRSNRSRSRSRSAGDRRQRSRTPPPPPSPPRSIPVIINRRGRFDDDDDEFEDNSSSTVYSFTPSRMSRAASTQPSSTHAEDKPFEKDEDDANGGGDGIRSSGGGQGLRKEPDRGLRLSHILESWYDGDHTLGGSHGAKITAVQSSRLKYQPLFRWLHCTRNHMDFEDFSKEVTRIPDLTAAEEKGIRDLLARVQRKFVKTVQTANGNSVRHMEPTCIQHVLPPDGTSKAPSVARRTVTWVCLPYFTLEKYSGLEGAPQNPAAFPIETLLQAKFSRAGRNRDMRQAVCQSKDTPTGLCFHVAQMWCLVLDNSFLFTYSRMAEETLRGDSVSLTVKSSQDISNARPQAIIAVSYRQTVLWSIPVEECQTWLDFLSHFRDFWPRRLQFFRRRRPVTADDWPRIWNMAKHVSDKVTLEMRIGNPPGPPPAGVLMPRDIDESVEREVIAGAHVQPQPPPGRSHATSEKLVSGQHTKPMPGISKSTPSSRLSIFSCLIGVTHPDFDTIDEEALDDHLREVEDYLLSRTSFSDRRAYTACPDATRSEVYAFLESQGVELSKSDDSQRVWQRDYEAKLDIFNAADVVFKFFFPLGVEAPTISKFWGALQIIITDGGLTASTDMEDGPRRIGRPVIPKYAIQSMRSELRGLCVDLQAFDEIFAHSGKREQARIAVPKEIIEGWIHLLMSLIYLPKANEKSERLLDDAKALIRSGMAAVVRSLSAKSLLDNSVLLPLELLSLLNLKLLQDMTVGRPDISECYSASLEEMEAEIAFKPSDRSREYRTSLLAEEISVVQRIVDTQTSIFQSLLSFTRETGQDEPARGGYSAPVHHADSRYRTRDRNTSDTVYHYRDSGRTRIPASEYREALPDRSQYGPSSRERTRSHSYEGDEPTMYYSVPPYVAANDPSTGFNLASTDPGGYRVLLLNECLQFLAGRDRDFAGFRGWASFLEKVNRNKIDTTKDRHDNAIYAFTIVTIIFLPLSAVASIFGMNTSDVRNMDGGQWVYWAVAVPVTAVVIFLGLLWTGELGNIVQWVLSFGPRQQGYQSLPDDIYYDYPPRPPTLAPMPGRPRRRLSEIAPSLLDPRSTEGKPPGGRIKNGNIL
ncbi:putative Mg2+ transporter [Cryphonectria parasitica EP155]|uniref:Mg2+ transporter n=1 Tax=Cryphonectria parasitica (strain ATCC 38755 / EP155) TaxID=660469 RepID=A0A9P4XY68_CRYP1|nr:putative Mg2+ transporter [Cryphonectria parasitica EP155]KAF3762955.1 putative Mg2+ transporter [Cryphonectria parasitica EP155]